MSNSIIFLILGVTCFALEALMALDGYFLWLGLSGLITSLISYFLPGMGITVSAVIFSLLSVLLIGAYRLWKHYHPDIPSVENLNAMTSRYIGKVYKIVDVSNGTAKIQISDALWRVRSESAELLEKGNSVRVIDQVSSTELKVISAKIPYQANPAVETPQTFHQQFSMLSTLKHARKYPELLQLFAKVHELYNKKPDFSFERSAFYHSYLPQSVEVFQKLDAGIKLDKQENIHLKQTVQQLTQRFRDILDIHHSNKKDKLLARIDVLNAISKE